MTDTLSPMQQRIKARLLAQPAKDKYIDNRYLWSKWKQIRKHLSTATHVEYRITQQHVLLVNQQFLLAQKKSKMRLASYLDWVAYTPRHLAFAIETGQVEDYYWYQMSDPRSDPNIWKRQLEEKALKTYYAQRAGRTP